MRWDVGALPMRAFVPGLTVQPLLENAIYHGIEPLEHGGTVTVSGSVVDGEVEIVVQQPGRARARRAERARAATASRSTTSGSGSISRTAADGSLTIEQRPDQLRSHRALSVHRMSAGRA